MITSPTNPLVKRVARLASRRVRDRQGVFVIEGRRPLEMAVAAGVDIQQVVVCPELGGRAKVEAPTVEMGEAAFRRASYRQNPDGILAIARHLDTDLARLQPAAMALVLVCEAIEKPGNLGAMLRTCDAAGVDALVVAGHGTDLHNPNVVRASQGALFTVPVAVAATTEVVSWLDQGGIQLLAAETQAGTAPWDLDLTVPTAVAVGAEDEGLSAALTRAAARSVTIPMRGRSDSLNASIAAAVVLFEAVRQRQSETRQ